MNWEFRANSLAELAAIEHSVLKSKREATVVEQWQLTQLLKALGRAELLNFPVHARHTPECVPDFQLSLAGMPIGVEATRIAVADVEHARALQQNGFNQTLSISSLYQKQAKPRSRSQVLQEAFVYPAEYVGISVADHERIWMEEAEKSLSTKTAALQSANFVHGSEDWLVLWDRIGTTDWQFQKRKAAVEELLQKYWHQCWFSRVFLQDEYFRWQLMFTKTQSILLGATASI